MLSASVYVEVRALHSRIAWSEEHTNYVQGRCVRKALYRGVEGGFLV